MFLHNSLPNQTTISGNGIASASNREGDGIREGMRKILEHNKPQKIRSKMRTGEILRHYLG